MATQDQSDEKSRLKQAQDGADEHAPQQNRSSELETPDVQFERFGDDDPHLPQRIASLASETGDFLSEVGKSFDGLGDASPRELRQFQSDASERARWGQSQKNAFQGIIRLGNRTPSRTNRVL